MQYHHESDGSVRAMFTAGCWYPLSPKMEEGEMKEILPVWGRPSYVYKLCSAIQDSIVFSNINALKL